MTAWKFLVKTDKWYTDPDDSTREYRGFLIVVVAPGLDAARSRAREWMAQEGHDVGWLKVATVHEIPVADGCVLAYAEA